MTTTDVTRTCQDESANPFTSAGLVASLEQAWAAIRARHPEVPAAVVVVAPASSFKGNAMVWGYFESQRWQSGTDRLPEVMVSGEGLSRTPAEVFTTLLHEATHGLAHTRDIKDTSRQGRYHNKQFAKLAAELGMTTVKDDKLGFSPCTLTETTTTHYADQITAIGQALRAFRHTDTPQEKTRTNNNNGVTAECDCPRKIRVSVAVFDAAPIWCGECGEAFLPEDTDRKAFNADNPKPGQPRNHNDDQGNNADPDTDDQEAEDMNFYDPTGQRYGIPTYPFRMAPNGLATIRQLRAEGLRPNGQEPAAQLLWRKGKRVAYLYHIDQAAPKRTATPRQREAIAKALLARRICPTCTQTKPYYIPRRHGECLDCAPERAR